MELQQRVSSHPNKNRSFHYLPYRTDSGFEQTFLREVLSFDIIEELGLEVYYNGDRAMTEFKIKCYKKPVENGITLVFTHRTSLSLNEKMALSIRLL